MVNIKFKHKSIFSRQKLLWIKYIFRIISFILILSTLLFEIVYLTNIVVLPVSVGLVILIIVNIILLVRLIQEGINPIELKTNGTLIKIKNLNLNLYKLYKSDIVSGYGLLFNINGEKISLYIHNSVKFLPEALDFSWTIDALLRVNEEYDIKYLSKSKLITEINSITHPELNKVIENCFITKRISKKNRRKALESLKKYKRDKT